MLVSEYQSIDMHCIVLPVKFDDRLSISVLRNKQHFKKNGRQKFPFSDFEIFQPRHLKKGQTLEKGGTLQAEPPGQNQSVYAEFCGQ
jgi:hypothetical protein